MTDFLYFQNYKPAADICTVALCLLNMVFYRSSYSSRSKHTMLFSNANFFILFSAISSVLFHSFAIDNTGYDWAVLLLYNITYDFIVVAYGLFTLYFADVVNMSANDRKRLVIFIWILEITHILAEVQSIFTHYGFWIESVNGVRVIHENYYFSIFRFYYVTFAVIILCMFVHYKNRFISRMYSVIANMMLIAYSLNIVCSLRQSTSMLCFSFSLPITTVLFLYHYNPYDVNTGTMDNAAFNGYIKNTSDMSNSFIFLKVDNRVREENSELSSLFFKFNEAYFKKCYSFAVSDQMMVIAVRRLSNLDFENRLERFLKDLEELYDKYDIMYHVAIIEANDSCETAQDYAEIANVICQNLSNKEVYRATSEDYERYKRVNYIVNQIRDIERLGNLEDERVKVYCQPVLNTRSGKFTTAESLMRLELDGIGMIYPDEFIPIAERYNLIHILSKVILYKTARAIAEFDYEKYEMERISVNFSALELKNPAFCDDIINIIDKAGIDYSRIAIEITESQNEDDFELVKGIMAKLHSKGIKFYLDDFGTGYSNFSRIMGLPIDIVKFDRSLTIMSGQTSQSKYMVNSFSDMFVKANYQVLYEGVEDEADETRCKEMNAIYLQGYKYSKPIPIMEVKKFLSQKVI